MDLRLSLHASKSANAPSDSDQLRKHKENLFGAGPFTHETPVLGKRKQEDCPFKEMGVGGHGGGGKGKGGTRKKETGGKEEATKNTTWTLKTYLKMSMTSPEKG